MRSNPTSLTTADLTETPPLGFEDKRAADPSAHLRPAGSFELPPQGLVFEDLERELVRQALGRTRGNQTRAAKLLGMTRDQIRYRIRKFSLASAGDGAAPDGSDAQPPSGDGDGP